jgi:hypothetical protein
MGLWIIRICVAAILGLVVTGIHAQAPLVTLNCPPHKNNQYDYPEPENCASPDILISLTILDLWHGTGVFIRENRDDINALSTMAIAVFTFTLWRSTRRLWQATRQAVDGGNRALEIANKTYVSTHRPRIIVRGLATFLRPSSKNIVEIRFTVHNNGDTLADILEYKFYMFLSDEHRKYNPIVLQDAPALPCRIDAGRDVLWSCHTDLNLLKFINENNRVFWEFDKPPHDWEFRGTIYYADINGGRRQSSFHRAYDFKTKRFRKIEDSEFEYGD